jgi:hypothetical protein
MKEEWKPIPGYEGYYKVSNFGGIESLKSRYRWKAGKMSPHLTYYGYRRVRLCVNGVQKIFGVHQLVCLAFIGPLPDRHEVNHKNGIKSDNRLENLEYVTRSQNQIHAIKIGLHKMLRGPDHWRYKYTRELLEKVLAEKRSGKTAKEVARKINCHYPSLLRAFKQRIGIGFQYA